MLDWKEIKGYDRNIDYKHQNDSVELPKLNEEILIWFCDETRPDRPPFVGWFEEKPIYDRVCGVWMVTAWDGLTLFEVQDGIKWARFNRP